MKETQSSPAVKITVVTFGKIQYRLDINFIHFLKISKINMYESISKISITDLEDEEALHHLPFHGKNKKTLIP